MGETEEARGGDGRVIAVVDDTPDSRELYRIVLHGLARVVDYESGPAALAGFARERPDLVVLDIQMPGMTGFEVLERIRGDERLRHLPVIATTAHAPESDAGTFLAAGFDDFIAKPLLDFDRVIDVVRRHLASGGRQGGA